MPNPKKTKRRYIKIVKQRLTFIVLAIFSSIIFLKYWIISRTPLIYTGEFWWPMFSLYIMKFGVFDYILKAPFLIAYQEGPMTAYFLIPFLYIFGKTAFALRAPIVIISLSTAVLTYLFANDFFDKRTAILTAFAFAIMPAYMPPSKEHALLPFFLILSLYIFNKFYKTRNIRYFYLFSIVCGLGLTVRISSLFWITSLILTLWIAFNNLKSTIRIRHLLVAFLLFALATYQYNMPNVWGVVIEKSSFPGVHTKLGGITIVEAIIKNIPAYLQETSHGVHLLDVITNLRNGLTKNFPNILKGSSHVGMQPLSLFLYLFPFSLALFLITSIYNWIRYGTVSNKDAFLFLNLLITFIFISTLTITEFSPEEFLIVIPFCSIIVGRGSSEILKVFDRSIKSLSYVAIALMGLFLLANTNIFLRTFINDDILYESGSNCVSEAGKVVDSLIELNHSSIYLTDRSQVMVFNWHFYNRGSQDERLYIFFDEKEFDNNALYTLSGAVCTDGVKSGRSIENFIETMSRRDKTVVLEEPFYLESGNLAYAIYKIA